MERREAEIWKERGRAAISVTSEQPYAGKELRSLHIAITGEYGWFVTFDEAIKAWYELVEVLYQKANGEGSDNRRAAEMKMEGIATVLEKISRNEQPIKPVSRS